MALINGVCDICKHNTSNVHEYGDWVCEQCGQKYEYNECHMIVLTEKQLNTLRQLLAEEQK